MPVVAREFLGEARFLPGNELDANLLELGEHRWNDDTELLECLDVLAENDGAALLVECGHHVVPLAHEWRDLPSEPEVQLQPRSDADVVLEIEGILPLIVVEFPLPS